ncbi:MAG: trypsin-like peptidase domain-containing protein [Kiloniellales bacterium]|nr:trypsin-like peptidase domain-containing protein [Kiloniellales bacterium]
MRRVFALVLLAALAPAAALGAFEERALESVVTLWPVWPDPGAAAARKEPQGSAVAIAPGGFLVTALHVVRGAEEIRVVPRSGPQLEARLLGSDPATDLALLKVEAELPVLEPAPPPALGAPVCALGNPFGSGLSVSCGVVSARDRTGMGFNPIEDFIQTDAAVNPGMSGGALVDGQGRLLGVLLAIFTREADGDIGLNFAASRQLVERVVEDLMAGPTVRRSAPGFRVAGLSRADQLRWRGVRIVAVGAEGAAAAAGLAPGDVVTAIGERAVAKPSDVATAIQLHRPGDAVVIDFLRAGEARQATLTLPE